MDNEEPNLNHREIKFRAWDLSNKAMYSHEQLLDGSEVNPDVLLDCLNQPGNGYDTDTVLMQFTGLKDRNGKEIYDQDYFVAGGIRALIHYSVNHCGWFWGSERLTLAYSKQGVVTGNFYETLETLK